MVKRLKVLMLQLRNRSLLGVDVLLGLFIPALALYIRTESVDALSLYARPLLIFTFVSLVSKVVVFFMTGLYTQYWRYASVEELITLLRATMFAWLLEIVLFFGLLLPFGFLPLGFPRSVVILDGLLTLLFVSGTRLSIRLFFAFYVRKDEGKTFRPALVVGAGVAGAMIVKELQANKQLGLEPVGYVDDDTAKSGKRIHGVEVLGTLEDIPVLLRELKIAEVIIAMPTAPGKVIRDVVQACKASGVVSKTIPGLFEILRGTAKVAQFRSIQLEDLLRRGAVKTDTEKVVGLLHGMRVMITGAGGSIGSELCRQIKDFGPSELILVGHGENSINDVFRELQEVTKQGVKIHPVIGDVRDRERMEQVFATYRPQIVFHAAAHKHVPLMEINTADAISNNVLGTRNLTDLSERHRVERFVMISSDKAVNPTSIMGVTKRIAELIVQEAAFRSKQPFVAVRFGNVLGSSGSVVPLMKRQIELGGPITVTHPEMRRYFMTIPEAVQLVLQAATMGTGGEVFVLDMGEPIKIVDLARDLIRLSGLEEGRDIDIVFSGIRPGEKLYEELFFDGDKIERTRHEKIMVYRNGSSYVHEPAATDVDGRALQGVVLAGYEKPLRLDVDTLLEAAQQGSVHVVRRLLSKIVPEYTPQDATFGPAETGGKIQPAKHSGGSVPIQARVQ